MVDDIQDLEQEFLLSICPFHGEHFIRKTWMQRVKLYIRVMKDFVLKFGKL